MPLSRRAVYLLLLVVLSAQWIVPAPAGAVSAGDSKTYIEFILDASVSMTARLEGRKTRMDVAREVMEELIRELPETPGLEIALRVYGAELVRGMAPCEDSVLVQGFKPVRDARGPMITAVRDMKPKGMTPIGLSLELAAKDFPRDPDARKIVVLVTDGEESCGADPCAISRRLQEQGLMLKPYVVGFALSEKQAALVRCIGECFEASDTASLRKALTSIMVQAISPAVLEVQAFGGGENVTSRAGIQVFNALGQPAKPGRLSPDRSSLLFELDEGVYTVRGDLSVGSEVVTATQPNIMAKSGQTTRIRLDFGPLTGMIRVFARVGGQDASDRVDIEVTKAGAPVAAQWFGAPPVAMVPAGQYEVTVTLKGYPASARSASAWVSPNKESALVFDLPAPQATLAVRAIYVGQDITPSCEFRVLSAGQVKASSPAGRGQFVIQADPGVVGVVARYVGDVSVEKTVPGVRLVAGETTNVTVDFGDMLATLRARVVARGADVTAVSKVSLAGQRTVPDVPLRGAYRETITTPGAYGVMATYAGIESDIVEAYAKPGQVTDVVVEVKMPGQLVVTPRMEGKALSPDRVVCEVFEGTASMGRMIPQMGKLVMSLPEGVYTVRGSIDTPAPQMQEIPNVAIRSGVVTDLVMDFLTEARVRVIVTAAGKPFRDADVSLMQGTKFVSWMTEQSPGVWEIAREPGVYDVVIQPKAVGSDPIHLTGIELTRGKTIEKTVAVDPRGVIAVKLLAAGTPTSDADVGLVRDGKFLSWIERKQAGLFEITVAPGVYDVTVRPKVSGYKEQTVSPVEVPAGVRVEKVVEISGQGLLRIKVFSDGKPYSGVNVGLLMDGEFQKWISETARGVWEAQVAEGVYTVEIHPRDTGMGMSVRKLENIQVAGGATVEKTVDMGGQGVLRLRLQADGRPYSQADVALLINGEFQRWIDRTGSGTWEVRVAAGTYELQIHPQSERYPRTTLHGIEVPSGGTMERSYSFDELGTIRVKLMVDDAPYSSADVVLCEFGGDGRDFVSRGRGVFEIQAAEGFYDIEIFPYDDVSEKTIYDIEVAAGDTTEIEIQLERW